MITAKLQFFITIASILKPFLEVYQREAPMLVFIGEDLKKLVRSLMKKFVKKDILEKADSPTKLASVNLKTKDNLLPPRKTDVGVATASLLTTCIATELQRL